VLFNSEAKSFVQRRTGLDFLDSGEKVEIPGVQFEWPAGAGQPGGLGSAGEVRQSPIATSLRTSARSLGADEPLRMKLRHPRPVYFMAPKDGMEGDSKERFSEGSVFLMTAAESWNEDRPYLTRDRTPKYEEPKQGEPRGTLESHRRGPFPIGVAAEVTVPASWYGPKESAGAKARVAVIGHGGAFTGDELSPTQKQLVLDVSNWLLGRDDLLAKEGTVWQFPRLELSGTGEMLIFLLLVVGPPALSIFLGAVVFLVRRMR